MELLDDTYTLRYMRLTDVPRVVLVDQLSFSTPWSAASYAREVADSQRSYMLVVERVEQIPPRNRLHELWQQLTGHREMHQRLLAYGGLWVFPYEGHISTLASHPNLRGRGWGELALLALLLRAQDLDVWRVVLEVRVSNERAQALYKKYGFTVRSVKQGYYYDNNEDAYDMVVDLDRADTRAHLQTRYQYYCTRYDLQDHFTQTPRPSR